MPRNITPIDDKLAPPESMPDRSHLAVLYERHGKKNVATEPHSVSTTVDSEKKRIRFFDVVIVNLFIFLPYAMSYLSIAAIYSLEKPVDINTALQNRINMTLFTVTALLPWLFSLRYTRNYLSHYQIKFPVFFIIYLFFIFPVIDLSIQFHNKGVANIIILVATFVMSLVFIWLILSAFNVKKISITPFIPAAMLIFLLVLMAAML